PRRWSAHPLLVRGLERDDRARHRAPRRVRAQALEALKRMASAIDDNAGARSAVLARVREALGHRAGAKGALARATAYLAGREQGPRPRLPADLVAHFAHRATEMASTVDRIAA